MIASMQSSLHHFRQSIAPIGAGAHPDMVSGVTVTVHQSTLPLIALASLSLSSPNCIAISPWDANTIPMIEKALWGCGLDGVPSVVGQVIRFSFPPMSQERRHLLLKHIQDLGEQSKVAIRAHRQNALKLLAQDVRASQDNVLHVKKSIQDKTDRFIGEIDQLIKQKQQEILAGS